MKETWLYKQLDYLHTQNSIREDYSSSGSLELLFNFTIVPLLGILLHLAGILIILLLPLYLIKDLYDLYYYLNAEKIAKKEAIKKALELKNNIKNWIKKYQFKLDNTSTYMLEKITYEEKLKVEQLPGVNVGYQSGIEYGIIHVKMPSRSSRYGRYNHNTQHNIKKEILSKEFINSRHSKFEDFILQFLIQYNNECNTIDYYNDRHICDTNRRRSLHDIYLITKYYYPEVTFIDIIKTIISLLKIGVICGSYCSTVNKYVFYTPSVSPHNSFGHTLEFTNELTFNDLKKYIENEHITK